MVVDVPTRTPTEQVPDALVCISLRKRFATRVAVDDVSLALSPGEVYGLLGPNGAGKTTTIKMVCGLLVPDAGSITVGGRRAIGDRHVRARIGYVPQDIALYPDLTARENLSFLGRLYGLHGATLVERVDEALELTELSDRGSDRVESYSGGMRRRLNLAAGLLNHPSLLVLDEPTVGVDPQSRHAILQRVREFGRTGMAVLYTTHYMEEAEQICDRIGIVDHGRLIAEGTRRDLIARLGGHARIDLGCTGDLEGLVATLGSLEGIERASAGERHVEVLARDGRHVLPSVLEAALRSGVEVRSVDVRQPDLEGVFLHLTGTALRE
jgi:linearmycin/streptolysin S transport system ATP-binding protein